MLLNMFQSNNLPILVLGHGRSGTTWIGNTLAQANNTLLYHEPCRKWFTYLEPGDQNDYFETHLNSAFKGLIDERSTVWFKGKKSLKTRLLPKHQIIVKEIASVTNIKWLRHNYKFQSIFVIRHPCSVALSEFERKVDSKSSLEELLKNKKLIALLSQKEIQTIYKAKTPFQQYAVIWALRNKPFSLIQKGNEPIDVITYESLASDPLKEFESLFKKFNLKWTKQIEQYISKSTSREKKGYYATSKIASDHIKRWKGKMTLEDIEHVKNFTLPFDIGFYNNHEDFI